MLSPLLFLAPAALSSLARDAALPALHVRAADTGEPIELRIDARLVAIEFAPGASVEQARAVVDGMLRASSVAGSIDGARDAADTHDEHADRVSWIDGPPDAPGEPIRLHASVRLADDSTPQRAVTLARALLASPCVAAAAPRLWAGAEPYRVTSDVLVRFRDDVDAAERASLLSGVGLAVRAELGFASNPGFVCAAASTTSSIAATGTTEPRDPFAALFACERLHACGRVEWAWPDFELERGVRRAPQLPRAPASGAPSTDPLLAQQWHLFNNGQSGAQPGADIDALGAWDYTRGKSDIVVAVIDEGFELAHPDVWLLPGIDVLNNDATPAADDGIFGFFAENHATAVAGLAAGRGNNSLGTSGVAQKCPIIPIRLLSGFPGIQPTIQDEVDAFVYARTHNASVINCSWGPTADVAPLPAPTQAAIDDCVAHGRNGLGCVICFAAGNSGVDCSGDGYVSYDKVIAIAASTDHDAHPSYSDVGAPLDFCAPSSGGTTSGLWTTDRLGAKGYGSGDYDGTFGGTSGACAVASGVAALVLSAQPLLQWDEVVAALREGVDKIDPINGAWDASTGKSPLYGFGRIDAKKSVLAALAKPPHGVQFYGDGLGGIFDVVPKIWGPYPPVVGNTGFVVTLGFAHPGKPAVLVGAVAPANLPILDGTLLVDVWQPIATWVVVPNAWGQGVVPVPIANTPGIAGKSAYFQWLVADPLAPQSISFSRGMQVTVF